MYFARSWVVDVCRISTSKTFPTLGHSPSRTSIPSSSAPAPRLRPDAAIDATNLTIGRTALAILRCPDDLNAQTNQGNLSYVVNGGFSRFPAAPIGWVGGANRRYVRQWSAPPVAADRDHLGFHSGYRPETGRHVPGCHDPHVALRRHGNQQHQVPWSVTTTLSSIVDGLSTTVLLGESTLSGYAPPGASVLRRRDELVLPPSQLHFVHGLRQCLRRRRG